MNLYDHPRTTKQNGFFHFISTKEINITNKYIQLVKTNVHIPSYKIHAFFYKITIIRLYVVFPQSDIKYQFISLCDLQRNMPTDAATKLRTILTLSKLDLSYRRKRPWF